MYDWLGASPDGIVNDETVLEIKCPFSLRNELLPQFKSIESQPLLRSIAARNGLHRQKQAHFYQWNQYSDSLEIVHLISNGLTAICQNLKRFMTNFWKRLTTLHLEPIVQTIETREAIMLLVEYDQVCEVIDNAEQRKKNCLSN